MTNLTEDKRERKTLSIPDLIAVLDFIRDNTYYGTAKSSDVELADAVNKAGITSKPVTPHNVKVVRSAAKIKVRRKSAAQKTASKKDLLKTIQALTDRINKLESK